MFIKKFKSLSLSIVFLSGILMLNTYCTQVDTQSNEEYDDEIGIESLYSRGEELGPFLLQSQARPSEGIWTFAAEKDHCSEFIIAPTQEAIDKNIKVAFFWYNNTPDHPDYATSTSGGFIDKNQKWYSMSKDGKGKLLYVTYNDAGHTTRGSNRHHNFQIKFRVKDKGEWKNLSANGDEQRKYVRFLMSSARPSVLPGEFDGGKGRDEPIYQADEWNTLLLRTNVIPGEKYEDVRAAENILEDINEGIANGDFTAEDVLAEIEQQQSGASENDIGSQSLLAALVAQGITSAKNIGQKLIQKGEDAVTQGIIKFFTSLFAEGCVSSTTVSESDDMIRVTLRNKAGY